MKQCLICNVLFGFRCIPNSKLTILLTILFACEGAGGEGAGGGGAGGGGAGAGGAGGVGGVEKKNVLCV